MDNYIAVHEEPEHITYFRIYRSAWTVFLTWKRFFPLIDWLMCTIQSNQTLDALIKYVALYHSSYWNSFKCIVFDQIIFFYLDQL